MGCIKVRCIIAYTNIEKNLAIIAYIENNLYF